MATKRSPSSDSETEESAPKRRKLRSVYIPEDPCYLEHLSLEVLCKLLQYLPLRDIMKLDTLSRRLREAVSLHLKLLRTLELSESNILGPMPSGITDYNLDCLVSRCPNLETIHGLFTGTRQISKDKLSCVLSVEGMIEILSSCSKLKSVELDNPYILESVLKKLPQLRILGSFINHGGGFPISDDAFYLSKNPKVRYLHLTGVTVPELPRMDSIIYLYLRFVKFTNPNPFSSFIAPNLHTFVMSNCAGPANALKYVPLVTRLAASRALRRLELVRVPFLGGLFQHVLEDTWKFGGFSSVENITFGACKHATEVDLGHLILTCAQKLFQLVIQPSLTKDNMFLALSMAEAAFPRIETLHLGYTDPFPEQGRWTSADLVNQGLSDVTEHPALITDTGVQLAGKMFSNLRNLIAYNCPYLRNPMKWLVEDGTNFAHLRYLHLHRCHSIKMSELSSFITDLPCLESVYLQEMFKEPPKGCGHVGLSAGTALGVSAAFLANQDGQPAGDPLPEPADPVPVNESADPSEEDTEFVSLRRKRIPPVGKVAMDVATAAGVACGHPTANLPSGSGRRQKTDPTEDRIDPKDRILVEEMDALMEAEENSKKTEKNNEINSCKIHETQNAENSTSNVATDDVTKGMCSAADDKEDVAESSEKTYEGKGKAPASGRRMVKGRRSKIWLEDVQPGSSSATSEGAQPGSSSTSEGAQTGSSSTSEGAQTGSSSTSEGAQTGSSSTAEGDHPGSSSTSEGAQPGSSSTSEGAQPGSSSPSVGAQPSADSTSEGAQPSPSTAKSEGAQPSISTATSEGAKPSASSTSEGAQPSPSTATSEGAQPSASSTSEGAQPSADSTSEGAQPSPSTAKSEGAQPSVSSTSEGARPNLSTATSKGAKPSPNTTTSEVAQPDPSTAKSEGAQPSSSTAASKGAQPSSSTASPSTKSPESADLDANRRPSNSEFCSDDLKQETPEKPAEKDPEPGTSKSVPLETTNKVETSDVANEKAEDMDDGSPKRTIGTQTTKSKSDHASDDSGQSEAEDGHPSCAACDTGQSHSSRPPLPVYRISRPGHQLAEIPQPPRILPVQSSCLVSLTLYMVGVEEVVLRNCTQLTTLHVTACRVLKTMSLGECVELYRITVAQCPLFDHRPLLHDVVRLRAIKSRLVFLRPMYKYDVGDVEKVLFAADTGYHGYLVRDHSLDPATTIHNKPRFEETVKLFSMINKSILKDWAYRHSAATASVGPDTSTTAESGYPWRRLLSTRTGESEDKSTWDVISDVPWLQTLYGTDNAQSSLHFTLGLAEFKKGLYRPKYHNHTVLANALKALEHDIAEFVSRGREPLYPFVVAAYINTCDIGGIPTQDMYV